MARNRHPVSAPAGLIGTAPSAELLAIWNERETALVDAGENAITLGSCLHTRPLGMLARCSTPGQLTGGGHHSRLPFISSECNTMPRHNKGQALGVVVTCHATCPSSS